MQWQFIEGCSKLNTQRCWVLDHRNLITSGEKDTLRWPSTRHKSLQLYRRGECWKTISQNSCRLLDCRLAFRELFYHNSPLGPGWSNHSNKSPRLSFPRQSSSLTRGPSYKLVHVYLVIKFLIWTQDYFFYLLLNDVIISRNNILSTFTMIHWMIQFPVSLLWPLWLCCPSMH